MISVCECLDCNRAHTATDPLKITFKEIRGKKGETIELVRQPMGYPS
jgi:hypothetical protein